MKIWACQRHFKSENEMTLNLVQTLEQLKSIYLSNEKVKRLFYDDWWYDVRKSLSVSCDVSEQVCLKANEAELTWENNFRFRTNKTLNQKRWPRHYSK